MKRALLVAAIAVASFQYLPAQTSEISGTVQDISGAVIPEAQVVVLNKGRGVQRTAKTNLSGFFAVPQLQPGTYLITVQADGFRALTRDNVTLNVDQPVNLDFLLRVGSVQDTIVVSSDAPLINLDSGAVSTTINSTFVDTLPLNGRTLQALLSLMPGTIPNTTRNSIGSYAVNGQRATSNATMIDGVSANIGGIFATATSNFGSAGILANGNTAGTTATGTTQAIITTDELQEFTVQTSGYNAEFGRQSGGQISFATKRGSNEFHGSLYEYFRNEALDANDWFLNQAGQPRVKLRQNDLGGTVGGPILKDKSYFFAAYENDGLRTPAILQSTVPSKAYKNAALPALRSLLDAFPLPNRAIDPGGQTGTFLLADSNQNSTNATSVRLDENIGKRLTLFSRYHRAPSRVFNPGVGSDVLIFSKTDTVTAGGTFVFAPHFLDDFRVNYSRSATGQLRGWSSRGGAIAPPDSAIWPSGFGIARDSGFVILMDAAFSTLLVGPVAKTVQHQMQFTDGITLLRGNHQFRFGVDWRRTFPHYEAQNYDITNVIVDSPSGQLQTFASAQDAVTLSIQSTSLYAQDSWKVSPRLNVELGLRWELTPAPTTSEGPLPFAAQNFDPNNPLAATLAPIGTPLWKMRYRNFAPRLGAAYHLHRAANWDTALRGAFGVTYDLGIGDVLGFIGDPPFTRSTPELDGTYPVPIASAIPPAAKLTTPFNVSGAFKVFDPALQMPYTLDWNFGIQQMLGADQALTLSYVGKNGRRLLRTVLGQKPGAANNSFGASNVLQTLNQGTSSYNALQVSFNRRLAHGLQSLVNYTWSHSIDVNSADGVLNMGAGGSNFLPNTVVPLALDRASSDFDVRHAFAAGVTYVVPHFSNPFLHHAVGGWSIDPLIRAYSAHPIPPITYNLTLAGSSFVLRPDLVPGQPIWISDPTAARGTKINIAAFALPPFSKVTDVRQGTLARNSIRGFPSSQVDVALRRTFKLTERVNLQFSGELYNLLNHPNFNDPGPTFGSINNGRRLQPVAANFKSRSMLNSVNSSIGQLLPIYAFGGQRDIQLALKVLF